MNATTAEMVREIMLLRPATTEMIPIPKDVHQDALVEHFQAGHVRTEQHPARTNVTTVVMEKETLQQKLVTIVQMMVMDVLVDVFQELPQIGLVQEELQLIPMNASTAEMV